MSPKDTGEFGFETTDLNSPTDLPKVSDAFERQTRLVWGSRYPIREEEIPQSPYPQGSTIAQRIEIRKQRIAEKTVLMNTRWGVRSV